MKLENVIAKIVESGHFLDRNDTTVIGWSIQNNAEENFGNFISAIKEEDLKTEYVQPRDPKAKKIPVKKLEHSNFFITLGNSYAQIELFNEAMTVFREMANKGSNESTMLNDYGVALLNQMLANKVVNKEKLDLARKLILKAYTFDKKVSTDYHLYPAYLNLGLLRAVEAIYYYQIQIKALLS